MLLMVDMVLLISSFQRRVGWVDGLEESYSILLDWMVSDHQWDSICGIISTRFECLCSTYAGGLIYL